MALDFSKFNFFNRLGARARVLFLFGSIVLLIVLVYFGTQFLSNDDKTVGASRVAGAPQGLQSIPGSQLTPAYQRSVEQANLATKKKAQVSGESAVATLIDTGAAPTPNAGTCIICTEQSANIKDYLNDWVRKGLSADVAARLEQLADKNVPPEAFEAELNRLVKEGTLSPEQARLLLEQYKKQHGAGLLKNSAELMDKLITSGELPIDAANELLEAQKKNLSPSEYAALLQRMVKEGKISSGTAQRLLAQYSQQRAKQIVMQSIEGLRKMVRAGELSPEIAKELTELENRMAPLQEYMGVLDKHVASGKLAPLSAEKILAEFQKQKRDMGATASANQLLQEAEAAAFQELKDLLKEGKISQEVADQIAELIQKNIPLDQFKAFIQQLVQNNKLSPEIAPLKIADYEKVKGLREMIDRLEGLQANNAGISDYADALKRAVQSGLLTPEQAAQMLNEYNALHSQGAQVTQTPVTTEKFAQLQQRVAQGTTNAQPVAAQNTFASAQSQAIQETDQEKQARLNTLVSAMGSQAQQLISAWQPATMAHVAGSPATTNPAAQSGGSATGGANGTGNQAEGTSTPVIKAGTILFAVLDTAVNSDYPNSPIMATVVSGKYKGAKLMGKLNTEKTPAGQLDRVSLNFTIMTEDAWPKSKTITAYAIDPDTARTVMASSVDYHYMQRYGAIMATSFLQGYATSIMNVGTTVTSSGGSSQTRPPLSPQEKIAVGLGQIGQNLGATTQGYVNIPPTVKVDSGVGLGILFMADVT